MPITSWSHLVHVRNNIGNDCNIVHSIYHGHSMSVESCTEHLGCETGTANNDDIKVASDVEPCLSSSLVRPSTRLCKMMPYSAGSRSYPPPLMSLNSIAIKAHREDGRLVIKAFPSCPPRVYAERSDGRLILRILTNNSVPVKSRIDKINGVVKEIRENGHDEEERDAQEKVLKFASDEILRDKLKRPSRCKLKADTELIGCRGHFALQVLSCKTRS